MSDTGERGNAGLGCVILLTFALMFVMVVGTIGLYAIDLWRCAP